MQHSMEQVTSRLLDLTRHIPVLERNNHIAVLASRAGLDIDDINWYQSAKACAMSVAAQVNHRGFKDHGAAFEWLKVVLDEEERQQKLAQEFGHVRRAEPTRKAA